MMTSTKYLTAQTGNTDIDLPLVLGGTSVLGTWAWTPEASFSFNSGYLTATTNNINNRVDIYAYLAAGTYSLTSISYHLSNSTTNCTIYLDDAAILTYNQTTGNPISGVKNTVTGITIAISGVHKISIKSVAAGFNRTEAIIITRTA